MFEARMERAAVFWMTPILYSLDGNPFDQRRQLFELEYLTSSRAVLETLAENYIGVPEE
jgi:p-hydroxybenzoate 3-monooxygenase